MSCSSENMHINDLYLMLSPVTRYVTLSTTLCLLLLAACAPTGIYHTVKPGQTLYRIAMTYEVDEDRLARINQIKDPTQLRVNQKIYIPGRTQLRTVPVSAPSSGEQARPAATPPPAKSPPPSRAEKTKVNKPPSRQAATTVKPAKGFFIWPAEGQLLNKFGSQGQKVYKGIEIGVPQGTAVLAAAAGKVIYSGNEIPGFGNLIILEHSDSFFSVYGYNKQNLVKMNDYVGQGDKIALSGVPQSGQSARLHFEIRKGKSAVNPILYLP